jgi:predicted RecA/RadA family phage recombinase
MNNQKFLDTEGGKVNIAVPAESVSGELIRVGDIIGVLEADRDSYGKGVLVRRGVFNLSVVAASAVAVGQSLYHDGTVLTDDDTDAIFAGYAMQVISTPSTATIQVLLGH